MPNINDLLRTGRIVELHVCRQYEITPKNVPDRFSDRHLSRQAFEKIIAEFKDTRND